ncbi:MAG TPA: DUF6708 domain-containing protein [Pseudomonas sp.]|nr:DUF6708 domain-containing protein [Pseudomonas sp.]
MLNKLRTMLAERFGSQYPTVVLSAHQATGQQPMQLNEVDEHTKYYLSLKHFEDVAKGMWTGALVQVGSLIGLLVAGMAFIDGEFAWGIKGLAIAALFFLIPFTWEVLHPLPLPTLLNRRTRELYFELNGTLYHTPWDQVEAVTYEYQMVHQNTGAMRHAPLEVLMHCYGKPDQTILVNLVIPVGRSIEINLHFWEYLRAYMNNGPWFDPDGHHSESNEFVKSKLADQLQPSGYLAHSIQTIAEQKKAAGGRNYLTGIDTAILVGEMFFYPMHRTQQFTYAMAKRRSRNQWPAEVAERLRPDGPSTRLIDLEIDRGLITPAVSAEPTRSL